MFRRFPFAALPTHKLTNFEGNLLDAGYTDDDALCPTCRCLLNQASDCDGSEIAHWDSDDYDCIRVVSTKSVLAGSVLESIFNFECPLCRECSQHIPTNLGRHLPMTPQSNFTIIKSLRYHRMGDHFLLKLSVEYRDDGGNLIQKGLCRFHPLLENCRYLLRPFSLHTPSVHPT